MRRKACLVWVDFHPQLSGDLLHYCMREGDGKRLILLFLNRLVKRGYRHFILYIERPSDIWIAEMIYYFSLSCQEVDLKYSIGIWQYENNPCNWIEQLPFDWESIVNNAYRVFLRSDCWYDKYYRMEQLYIPIRESRVSSIS